MPLPRFSAGLKISGIAGRLASLLIVAALGAALIGASPADAKTPSATIAVAVSVTGAGSTFGAPAVEGARLAVEEANAAGLTPKIELAVHDDQSDANRGRELVRSIAKSDAITVVGPATTPMALAMGPVCTATGIVCIGTTTTGDTVTKSANLFRAVFSTSDVGETLANYLRLILGATRAVVLVNDDDYGRLVANGFKRAAERLRIETAYLSFKNDAEAEKVAGIAAADPRRPAVILAALDAATLLKTLRRQGAQGPILGTNTMAGEYFNARFSSEPEERRKSGYFTQGVYAASPLMFDSANAETLGFVERFRARFGHEPSYITAQGYEAMRLAIAAVRATAGGAAADMEARREAVREYLSSLDGPAHAIAGLAGPLWFTPERGRIQALRIGRFQDGRFESAPAQLVPVPSVDAAEIAAKEVVDIGSGRYARRQQVAYTGIYLNAIPRMDIAQSRFTADFYIWLRYSHDAGAGAADPADIDFPDMIRGTSDGKLPAVKRDLADGTTYRLWRVRGDFKNDFDLHLYPADRQTLMIRFINARAATDRVVYVQDRQSPPAVNATQRKAGAAEEESAPEPETRQLKDNFGNAVQMDAFRELAQWQPLRVGQQRDSLVTKSALGDPNLVGLDRVRELSGYKVTIELRRRVIATLAKTMLPLGLMALILFASLHFPVALVKEKITVAITAALSGAVLLSSINAQLGNVGYIIAIEYGFYLFFTLCLLCIVVILMAERLRLVNKQVIALKIERWGRNVFAAGLMVGLFAVWLAEFRA